jgi:hypothetical protein
MGTSVSGAGRISHHANVETLELGSATSWTPAWISPPAVALPPIPTHSPVSVSVTEADSVGTLKVPVTLL